MIIEKLMPTGYFTPGLLGAQADLVCSIISKQSLFYLLLNLLSLYTVLFRPLSKD